MKKIKSLLFNSSKKLLISLVVSLVLLVIVPVLGSTIGQSNESLELVFIIALVLVMYAALIFLILVIIGLIRYLTTMNLFKKRIKEEGIEIDEEEFELVHKRLYVSKNYILYNLLGGSFVLHKTWIDRLEDKEIFKGNTFLPIIEIMAKNKKYMIQYSMKKKSDRELAMNRLQSMVNPLAVVQKSIEENVQPNQKTSVNLTEKQGGLNLITFALLSVILFIIFGFGYYYVSENFMSKQSPTIKDESNKDSTFRNVDFSENGEIEVTYEIIDDETVLYFYNNSEYAFKGKLMVTTDSAMENIETYWIRPQGYDYVPLKNKGTPEQYNINVELYRELVKPSTVDYYIYFSTLVDDYAFDVVVDENMSLDSIKEIAIDQGMYSDLEEVASLKLLFHDMDVATFLQELPPEDLSTLRYIVEINTETKEAIIYEATQDNQQEIERFNYEEAYNER